RGEETHQLVGQQDVDVGAEDELAPGPADADVLGDHLEQRQGLAVLEAAVQLRRHLDDADLTGARLGRPAQRLCQPRAVGGRVPRRVDFATARPYKLALL